MRAVQRVPRIPIMNKSQVVPALRRVTAVTICIWFSQLRSHKLALVQILVARRTLHRNGLHPHNLIAGSDLPYHVTRETGLLAMLAFQREAAELVIEGRAMPGVRAMTELASAFRNPRVELSLMRIFMTAFTR